jgi:hypothetical protein
MRAGWQTGVQRPVGTHDYVPRWSGDGHSGRLRFESSRGHRISGLSAVGRARPMGLWRFDVTGAVLLHDGTDCDAVTGIDDHSRLCEAAEVVTRATTRPVCTVFAAALSQYIYGYRPP